ncbi:MAG: hypothetical protein DMF64_18250 [Acidobacteria bacterium]|nr:MAG: hypothetical protein DMF64_18250 [Acidobacteriota bacterium]
MKRKLGIALLIIATVLAGTPEAVRQFHGLNRALRHWAGTNLGGSFLVYAEDGSDRALPDRYDYHQVAPPARLASYGLTASLSQPATHETPCPFEHRRAVERAQPALRTQATAHAVEQVARNQQRAERTIEREQLARDIRRTLKLTVKTFGGELSEQQLATKLRTLRMKPAAETLKTRRTVPVRVARINEGDLPFTYTLAPGPDASGFDADKIHR